MVYILDSWDIVLLHGVKEHQSILPSMQEGRFLPRFPVARQLVTGAWRGGGSDARATSLPSGSVLLRVGSPGCGAASPGHLPERFVVVLLRSSAGQPALPPVSTQEWMGKRFWCRYLRTPASSAPAVPAEDRIPRPPAALSLRPWDGHLFSVV